MVLIKPFRGLRPPPEIAASVSAPPYDVLSSEEARVIYKRCGEKCFLRVNKPEVDLPPDINPYDGQVYEQGFKNLRCFMKNGWLVPDKTPCFYIYSQQMEDHQQMGIVCGVPVADYERGIIRRHEKTQVKKENDRTLLTHRQNANAGPVFLTYKQNPDVDRLVGEITSNAPEVAFTADDGIAHKLWPVREGGVVMELQRAFEKVSNTYIADGHHRSASAFKVGQLKKKEAIERGDLVTGEEPFNFFLAVLFPADQLRVLAYNRVVHDLAGLSEEEFLKRVSDHFELSRVGDGDKLRGQPTGKGHIGMCLRGAWYRLAVKEGTYRVDDPVNAIDVQILYDNLLHPILEIGDPKVDERIMYVGGIRGVKELEKLVTGPDAWGEVAFSMYPVGIQQVMTVADAKRLMPPKATWFEPKLRSGLVVRLLDEVPGSLSPLLSSPSKQNSRQNVGRA